MMAHMTIYFEMDNAAFDDNAPGETARILRNLADRMELGINETTRIFDLNGNRIGQAEFYEDF